MASSALYPTVLPMMAPGLSVHFMVKHPPLDRMAMLVEYLSGTANEFVIVDTGSSERAKDTMRSWPRVRLYEEEFVDFATTRNKGLARHAFEWTLGLDPDELPSVLMMQHMVWAMTDGARDHPEAMGWLYWTRNFWDGIRGEEMEYHWHCRLWKTEHVRLYRPVHELVEIDGMSEDKTRGTPVMPLAPRMAYLIHSKSEDEIVKADELYARLGEVSK